MKNEKEGKYLPLGTVVKLKTGNKKLMITGFCLYDNEHGHVFYDYCGCMYPEGMLSNREANLFNHDEIDEIIYMGLSDDDDKLFKINLTSMIQIIQTINTNGENPSMNKELYQEE